MWRKIDGNDCNDDGHDDDHDGDHDGDHDDDHDNDVKEGSIWSLALSRPQASS